MRLGIMGGTFNPIHNAHLFIADAARLAAGLERVLFVTSGNPPHKSGLIDAEDRFAMTALAIRGLPWAEVSRMELDRAGTIYTVDTLTILGTERPDDRLFVIVGADTLRDVPNWRDARRAMELCELVAVSRPGFDEDDFQSAMTETREKTGARVTLVCAGSPDISSSQVRDRLRRGESVDGLIPGEVARYIAEKGLYRD